MVVLAAEETAELELHHLFLDLLLLWLEEVVAVATKEQPEPVEPVVVEMDLILLQLLVEMELTLPVVVAVAGEVLMEVLLRTEVLVVPAS